MKKVFIAVMAVALIFTASCSHRRGTPTSASSSDSYTNTGRLKSTSIDTYVELLGMTITATNTYGYDSAGRIRNTTGTYAGYTVKGNTYNYNSDGKLISIIGPQTSGSNDQYYTYDSSGRLATLSVITYDTTNTTMVQTFTYDSNNRISRIDEAIDGTAASYRLLTRDSSGYVTVENIYAPGGTTSAGTITYTRDNTLKTIKITMAFIWDTTFSMSVTYAYDSSGFYLSQTAEMPGLNQVITTVNALQDGPFDPAGMKGYYFTDSDLYGMTYISTYAYGYMP